MNKGRYIVLEGPAGVGKTTQIEIIAQKLEAAGYPVRLFQEPDVQSDLTVRAIRKIIQDPKYPVNTRTEVLLYNAARSQSLDAIRRARNQGAICLCDRNFLTTLAVQYYGRGDVPDYETISHIVRFAVADMEPDMTIVMDTPVQVLQARIKKDSSREQPEKSDASFLERVRAGYLWEARQRGYPVVFANNAPDKVAEAIWQLMNGHLVPRQSANENADAPNLSQPATPIKEVLEQKKETLDETQKEAYITKDKKGRYKITDAGRDFLDKAATNSDGDIYAFTDKLNPATTAAAMARFSRRGVDMRLTILDEFADTEGKDNKLLRQDIEAYGDDSVKQLAGQYLMVENASNLVIKKLERGRMSTYVEKADSMIRFDHKDNKGNYRYFTPERLPKKLAASYNKIMNEILDEYSDMAQKLAVYLREHSPAPKKDRDVDFNRDIRFQAYDAIRPVVPVAAKSAVGIYASGQGLENLIIGLLSDELPEAKSIGRSILKESRKVIPAFLYQADKPEHGGSITAYRANTRETFSKLADEQLSNSLGNLDDDVQLVDVWPRNELSLLPHMLYEHSNLSLKDIKKAIDNWSYDQKMEAFNTYMGERLNRRHRPGRALEIAHYSWDLICDFEIFRDLQRHRLVDGLEWQPLTPRYGFDIPELVEKAGLSEQFEKCFDKSAELYSLLQSKGFELEAQYATLLGHRIRWKITYNAREAFHLHELRTSPQGHPGYRRLVKQMHDKLAEVHPMLANAMKFINKDEDPELTRLAAERYTQFKLKQLK